MPEAGSLSVVADREDFDASVAIAKTVAFASGGEDEEGVADLAGAGGVFLRTWGEHDLVQSFVRVPSFSMPGV